MVDAGVGGLLKKYQGSPSKLLAEVFPEHNWLPWKFNISRHYLDNPQNQRIFLDWVGKQHNVKEMHDWYKLGAKV